TVQESNSWRTLRCTACSLPGTLPGGHAGIPARRPALGRLSRAHTNWEEREGRSDSGGRNRFRTRCHRLQEAARAPCLRPLPVFGGDCLWEAIRRHRSPFDVSRLRKTGVATVGMRLSLRLWLRLEKLERAGRLARSVEASRESTRCARAHEPARRPGLRRSSDADLPRCKRTALPRGAAARAA